MTVVMSVDIKNIYKQKMSVILPFIPLLLNFDDFSCRIKAKNAFYYSTTIFGSDFTNIRFLFNITF
jgi:hypothetical protein